MRQKQDLLGKVAIIIGILLLLTPLAQRGVSLYGQQQALRSLQTAMPTPDPQPIQEPQLPSEPNSNSQPEPEPTSSPTEPAAPEPPQLLLTIPRINLQAVVWPGITPDVLKRGPGLYPQSSKQPSQGNIAIAAHRGVYGAWFRHLNQLTPGDSILLQWNGTTYEYQVREQFITHDHDWSVIKSNGQAELTLTTCLFSTNNKRLIIKADLVQLTPASLPQKKAHTSSKDVSQLNDQPRQPACGRDPALIEMQGRTTRAPLPNHQPR